MAKSRGNAAGKDSANAPCWCNRLEITASVGIERYLQRLALLR